MATIQFSGLASGIDTASLVDSIIEVESVPLDDMEDQQTYLETKLSAYEELNTLVTEISSIVMSLNSEDDLVSFEVENNGSDAFSFTTSSISSEGSYSIEVLSLAQQQKDVSEEGFSDTDETTISGELQIGDETLSYEDVTLSELVDMIEEGDYGVSAEIIDDGTDEGYRLMLTADTAGEEIDITGTGDIVMDTAEDGHTVEGTQAHITVDGIDFYSSSNTITSAVKGATITLQDVSDSGADQVTVSSSTEDVLQEGLQDLIDGYNALVTYKDALYESDPTLANSMSSIERGIKSFLTSSTMANLGISTDWETGELELDTDLFSEAYENDPEGVVASLIGEDGDETGVMNRLDSYLEELEDSSTGFFAVKEATIEKQISRLDDDMDRMETRLEKRRETLEAQFTAMETLISTLESQGDYLTSFFDSYSSSD